MTLPTTQSLAPWTKYTLALLAIAAATAPRVLLSPWLDPSAVHYATFYAAVAVVALLWGRGPGILATFASVLACFFFILPHGFSYLLDSRIEFFPLGLFLATGLLVSILAGKLHATRKLVEQHAQALRENRATLNLVLNTVPQAVFWKDLDGHYLGCNRQFASAVGLPDPADVVGKTDSDLTWSTEEAQAYRADDHAVTSTGNPKLHIIEPVRCADGSLIWADTCKLPLRDPQGNIYGLLGVYDDITQRKQNEETLRQNAQWHRTILQTAQSGFLLTDMHGQLLEVNEAYCRMSGYSEHELLALRIPDLDALETPDDVAARMQKIMTQGYDHFESRHRRKDGSLYDVEINNVYRPEQGGRLVTFLRDITETKQIENALKFLAQCTAAPDQDFFAQLARFLAQTLAMDYVCIDTLQPDSLSAQTLAICFDGKTEPNVAYALKDTPCGQVVGKHICCFPQDVRHQFPNDPVLQEMLAESYVGTTLFNSRGQPIGLIAVIGRKPLTNPNRATSLLQLVAVRAAGELERKQAEEALRASETRFRELYERSPIGYQSLDADGRFIEVNQAWLDTLGYSRPEVLGHWFGEFLSAPYVEAFRQRFPRFKQVGEVHNEFEMKHKDGSIKIVAFDGRIGYDSDGQFKQTHCVLRDITERKHAETELQNSRMMLQLVLDTIPFYICWKDRQSTFLGCNRNYADLAGLPHTQNIVGKTDWDLPWTKQQTQSFIEVDRRIMDAGQPEYGIIELVLDAHGQQRWLETNKVPLRDPDHNVNGILVAFQDITARKQSELELLHAKETAEAATREKDQFLAKLSHELRTPLTPVLLAVSRWQNQPDTPQALREDFAMLARNLELEARLLDDLLDVNRILYGKLTLRLETVPLHLALQQALAIVNSAAQAKHLQLNLQLHAPNDSVRGDLARLQQVFWNLLSNAIKFTPDGGSITLTTSNAPDGSIQIQISDTGMGINPHALADLFQPFEQGGHLVNRQFGGLGLGLTICRSLVEAHAGSITVASPGLGHGATFTIRLPLTQAPLTTTPAPSAPDAPTPAPTCPLRILLVEDHPDTARMFSRLLQAEGYAVQTAPSVASALQLAHQDTFDLLISDLGLPDGTGIDLIQQLAASGKTLKAIAVSGFGMEDDIRKSRNAGFLEHLTKPINLPQLLATIHRITTPQETLQNNTR